MLQDVFSYFICFFDECSCLEFAALYHKIITESINLLSSKKLPFLGSFLKKFLLIIQDRSCRNTDNAVRFETVCRLELLDRPDSCLAVRCSLLPCRTRTSRRNRIAVRVEPYLERHYLASFG